MGRADIKGAMALETAPTATDGTEGAPSEEGYGSPPPAARLRGGIIVSYALTVFILLTINFFLPRAMPGDPVSAMVREGGPSAAADPASRRALDRYYGMDRPLLHQYGAYLGRLAQGDLGTSLRSRTPVRRLIGERLPWTLLLSLSSIALTMLLGSVTGIHAGWRQGRQADRRLTALFMGLRSVPPFFLASLALFAFSAKLGWFPLGGATTPFSGFGPLRRLVDIAHHLALPLSVLVIQGMAFQYLLMRSSMVAEAGADYVVLGRAKGVSESRLKYRHAARNALLPAVTNTAAEFGFALTGTVFVETVFAYPGLGRLLFEAVSAHDYPVLQGCFVLLTLGVVAVNLVADLIYPRLDPRAAE